jgi:hypothetical protein
MARRVYDVEKKHCAFQMYAGGATSLHGIARMLNVPYGTVHGWHTRDRWAGTLRQMKAKLREEWVAGHSFEWCNPSTLLEDAVEALRAGCSVLSGVALEMSNRGVTNADLHALGKAARGLASAVKRVNEVVCVPRPAKPTEQCDWWHGVSASAKKLEC